MRVASHSKNTNQQDLIILLSLIPYLRTSMFLILLYVMGLATVMSIKSSQTHPSQNILLLMLSILKIARWMSKNVF
jgi:hypothetical protein